MKHLEKMTKQELLEVAETRGLNVDANATEAVLLGLLQPKKPTTGETFKMLKTHYESRPDARVAKNYPTITGELKVRREIEWNDERNTKNETLIFFQIGGGDECLIFSGALVAAAEKANIELFSETDEGLVLNQGFIAKTEPRKFEFDSVK